MKKAILVISSMLVLSIPVMALAPQTQVATSQAGLWLSQLSGPADLNAPGAIEKIAQDMCNNLPFWTPDSLDQLEEEFHLSQELWSLYITEQLLRAAQGHLLTEEQVDETEFNRLFNMAMALANYDSPYIQVKVLKNLLELFKLKPELCTFTRMEQVTKRVLVMLEKDHAYVQNEWGHLWAELWELEAFKPVVTRLYIDAFNGKEKFPRKELRVRRVLEQMEMILQYRRHEADWIKQSQIMKHIVPWIFTFQDLKWAHQLGSVLTLSREFELLHQLAHLKEGRYKKQTLSPEILLFYQMYWLTGPELSVQNITIEYKRWMKEIYARMSTDISSKPLVLIKTFQDLMRKVGIPSDKRLRYANNPQPFSVLAEAVLNKNDLRACVLGRDISLGRMAWEERSALQFQAMARRNSLYEPERRVARIILIELLKLDYQEKRSFNRVAAIWKAWHSEIASWLDMTNDPAWGAEIDLLQKKRVYKRTGSSAVLLDVLGQSLSEAEGISEADLRTALRGLELKEQLTVQEYKILLRLVERISDPAVDNLIKDAIVAQVWLRLGQLTQLNIREEAILVRLLWEFSVKIVTQKYFRESFLDYVSQVNSNQPVIMSLIRALAALKARGEEALVRPVLERVLTHMEYNVMQEDMLEDTLELLYVVIDDLGLTEGLFELACRVIRMDRVGIPDKLIEIIMALMAQDYDRVRLFNELIAAIRAQSDKKSKDLYSGLMHRWILALPQDQIVQFIEQCQLKNHIEKWLQEERTVPMAASCLFRLEVSEPEFVLAQAVVLKSWAEDDGDIVYEVDMEDEDGVQEELAINGWIALGLGRQALVNASGDVVDQACIDRLIALQALLGEVNEVNDDDQMDELIAKIMQEIEHAVEVLHNKQLLVANDLKGIVIAMITKKVKLLFESGAEGSAQTGIVQQLESLLAVLDEEGEAQLVVELNSVLSVDQLNPSQWNPVQHRIMIQLLDRIYQKERASSLVENELYALFLSQIQNNPDLVAKHIQKAVNVMEQDPQNEALYAAAWGIFLSTLSNEEVDPQVQEYAAQGLVAQAFYRDGDMSGRVADLDQLLHWSEQRMRGEQVGLWKKAEELPLSVKYVLLALGSYKITSENANQPENLLRKAVVEHMNSASDFEAGLFLASDRLREWPIPKQVKVDLSLLAQQAGELRTLAHRRSDGGIVYHPELVKYPQVYTRVQIKEEQLRSPQGGESLLQLMQRNIDQAQALAAEWNLAEEQEALGLLRAQQVLEGTEAQNEDFLRYERWVVILNLVRYETEHKGDQTLAEFWTRYWQDLEHLYQDGVLLEKQGGHSFYQYDQQLYGLLAAQGVRGLARQAELNAFAEDIQLRWAA